MWREIIRHAFGIVGDWSRYRLCLVAEWLAVKTGSPAVRRYANDRWGRLVRHLEAVVIDTK